MPGEHGEIERIEDKRVALLIAVLALCLALVETGGKSAQTEAISLNVQSSDTWTFYQARVVRETVVKTAAELAALSHAPGTDAAADAQIKTWQAMAARWEDDPKGGDGRKQLAARARGVEAQREEAMARYHLYEYAGGLLQVAIVVASASIVTAMPVLAVLSGVLGALGAVLGAVGFSAPELLARFLH